MTALVTSLALVPIVTGGDRSGLGIEHPMAVVILGGPVTSTILNMFLLPAIYLRYGQAGDDTGGDPWLGSGGHCWRRSPPR